MAPAELPTRSVSALTIAVALAAAAIGGLLSSLWPTAAVVVGAVALILALCISAPAYAFLGALVLYSFEGSIKMRLSVEQAPSPLAVGAGLLDFAFLASLISLLVQDRGRSLARVWTQLARWERIAGGLFAAWLCLSVLQISFGGDLIEGLEGFRLTQFYVPALLGGIVLASRLGPQRLPAALLGIVFLAAAYAALRGFIGPSFNEQAFAEQRTFHTEFGEFGRNIGSFTAPIPLASFLVPAAITCMVLGFLLPNLRRVAWALFALAMVGIITSYVRTALVAVIAGAAILAFLLLVTGEGGRRRKAYAVGLVVLVLIGGYGATLLAGRWAPQAEERAQSLANPLADESITTRLGTWERSLETVADEPLGTGLGTVGRASLRGRRAATTDNSYLKVLEEQGPLGALLFLAGLGGILTAVAIRLARLGIARSAPGVAALAAFIGFSVLMLMGEYIEQPGKLIAWALLGIAIWEVAGRRRGDERHGTTVPSVGASLAAAKGLPRSRLVLGAACAMVAVVVSVGLTASRQREYRASSTLVLSQAGVPDPERNAPRAAKLINDTLDRPDIRLDMVKNMDFMAPAEVSRRTWVTTRRLGGRWKFRLTASGPTVREAHQLARGSVPVFGLLGILHSLVVSRTQTMRLRQTLRTTALEPAERKALRQRIRTLDRRRLKPTARPSAPTFPPRSDRLIDRLGHAVAAKATPAPNLVWALVAALLFALATAAALLFVAIRPHAGRRP